MPIIATRNSWDKWRLPLLAAIIVVIVLLPFMLLRASTQKTLDAADWVIHTREVEAAANELAYDARDIEAAAQSLALGIDAPIIHVRLAESTAALSATMATITRLTRDNPEQQIRIGLLKATLDQRMRLVERVVRTQDRERARRDIEVLVTRFPIRYITNDIKAEEHRLLARRTFEAEHLRNQTLSLTWVAMSAQLLLLGLLTYFSQRQIGRRLDAERDSQRADARAQTVLQTVREPIVLLDARQRVVMHNAAFSELNGSTMAAQWAVHWLMSAEACGAIPRRCNA